MKRTLNSINKRTFLIVMIAMKGINDNDNRKNDNEREEENNRKEEIK